MGAHLFNLDARDVATTTDGWYTPRWIFDAARVRFDMDVCAPVNPEMRTCPAETFLTPLEDGLTTPWHGVVWCNPPYSNSAPWIEKWASHHNGILLVPAVKATWLRLLLAADALSILRVDFGRPDPSMSGELRWPVLIAAHGDIAVDALKRIARSDTCARGFYMVRPA